MEIANLPGTILMRILSHFQAMKQKAAEEQKQQRTKNSKAKNTISNSSPART